MVTEAKPSNAVCLTYSRALAASPFSANPAIFTISLFLLSLKSGSICRHCIHARSAKELIGSIHLLHKHVHSTNMYIHTCSCLWGRSSDRLRKLNSPLRIAPFLRKWRNSNARMAENFFPCDLLAFMPPSGWCHKHTHTHKHPPVSVCLH